MSSTVNGQAPKPEVPGDVRRSLREQIAAALTGGRPKKARALLESLFLWDAWGGSDLLDPIRPSSNDGPGWVSLAPPSVPSDRRHGQRWPVFRTQQELDLLRQEARLRVAGNSYAQGLLRNLTNNVIGRGFSYSFSPIIQKGEQPTPEQEVLCKQAQRVVDAFCRDNNWCGGGYPGCAGVVVGSREREIFRRVKGEDGECFVRFHYQDDGTTIVRFVEPERIRDMGGLPQEGWSFGIRHQMTPFEDVETVLEYRVFWPDPSAPGGGDNEGTSGAGTYEDLPADEVVHVRGLDTPATVKRGLSPFLFDAGRALDRASRVQQNASLGAAYRAATGEVWQHTVGTQAQITSLAAGLPGALPARPDPLSGDLIQSERVIPPAVRRVPASMEMKDLPTDQSESYLAAGQGDLRMAAAAFCAPEFWMAETSSGNYSNLESAAAPAVRDGQCEQIYFQSAFAACVWRAVRWAQQCGRLPPGLEDLIKLDIESPAVRHRNELEKAQEDQIGIMNGWKDRQTASEERGLEWELVRRRNEEHDARELKKQALQQKVLGPQQPPPPGGGPPHPPGGGGPRPPEPHPPRVTGGQMREGKEDEEEAPDPEEVAPLIAEVLYHLFGDDALDQLGSIQEAWAASDHPRGEGGRFIARGSAEAVSKAQEAIDGVLKGKGGDAREVANHLAILSVKQLRQLHQRNGVKKIPSVVLRQHLVDAVVDKLTTTNELHALRKEFTGLKGARPPDTMGAAALKKQIAMAKEKPAPREERPAAGGPAAPAGAAAKGPISFEQALRHGQEKYPDDRKAMKAQRGKEDWQIPVDLYVRGKWGAGTAEARFRNHRLEVQKALAAGKPVPPEVLADYPDLTKNG
jgi:hypothetical protein